MRYEAHRPSAPLGDHVECFWALSDAPDHRRERIVPSGTIELVINLHADEFRVFADQALRFRGAMVSGCYSREFEIDTQAHTHVLGVHFRPGGAARLLGVPPGALADTHVALDDLWGRSAAELRERLCGAPTEQQRIALLEQALVARLPDHRHPREAVRAALAELDRPGIEVGQVAEAVGLSRRRLIEIFTEDVGMTPKRYARVRRFQRALSFVLRDPSATWTRIAHECGYCDQSHLCREWHELAGMSPSEFIRLRGIPVKDNHVAVREEGVKSVQYTASVHG